MGYRYAPLMDDAGTRVPAVRYPSNAPGTSRRIDRSFENAPPLIPHDISDMLPIKRGKNLCISCHMPDVAVGMGATPVPRSHLVDLRTGRNLGGKLYQGRYFCIQCHVPQAELKPLIKNGF
ncbi:MAG: nitrate reductase [Deltaproteobacteria bacterium]|nr:nitrate reductase [Deltaproteobacteria bacterium]